jgi:hypothetical protein
VVLQRLLSVVLVLLGVGLGLLLPRPWAEVEEAVAAKKTRTVLCLTSGGHVLVHNASDQAIVVKVEYLGPEGQLANDDDLTLPPRYTDTIPSFGMGTAAYLTAPASTFILGVNSELGFSTCRVSK